ncbi:hypothetical protein O1611_g5473 [Lasiodiplodia mahajangana]|uniref:Uncharacterized protein n=1 Tax=Lasiodiplodia mahajangana TaxID=1108764 RepID=A0ACC2JKY4_9PEZI|nr:hypothetical protein O1611_g5473 [Lasiodiplodia mahajangana]
MCIRSNTHTLFLYVFGIERISTARLAVRFSSLRSPDVVASQLVLRLTTLETFNDDTQPVPPYAILSHTWGPDHEEISFHDLQDGITRTGPGRSKFDHCCSQATIDSLPYVWIDTCCIDKTSSAELSEAINSMFKWYQRAKICYAYLSDVDVDEDSRSMESSFSKSRWFQRGWTLQELIAPRIVKFYDFEWTYLGSKRDLTPVLTSITRIPRVTLLGVIPLSNASIAQRMSWAAGRVTKRKEDLAYCLLGIFGITMPMVYGEGDRAFLRLQEEITKHIDDDSILVWNFNEDRAIDISSQAFSGGALAPSPSNFANSNHIIVPSGSGRGSFTHRPLQTSGGSLLARRSIYTDVSGQCFVVLRCQHASKQGQAIGIPVQARLGGSGNYIRIHGRPAILLPKDMPQGGTEDIRIPISSSEGSNDELRPVFYVDNSLETDLTLLDVIPQIGWDRQRDTLIPNDGTTVGRLQRLWTRLRYEKDESDDFVIVLELISQASEVQARHHVMTCNRQVELDEIRKNFGAIDSCGLNKHSGSNGSLNLEATVSKETIETQDIFAISLFWAEESTDAYNVTNILHTLHREQEVVSAWEQYHQFRYGSLTPGTRDDCLKRAPMLQSSLNKQHEDITATKRAFPEFDEAAANEMVERLPLRDREYLGIASAELTHKFLFATAAIGYEPPFIKPAEQNFYVNIFTEKNISLIAAAVLGGNKRIVQTLIFLGAVIEPYDDNYLALRLASMCGCTDIVRLLVSYGAGIDNRRPDQRASLMEAVYEGHEAIVQVLLEHGANPNHNDPAGETALICGVLVGEEAIIRVLLQYGADIEHRNLQGRTALLCAAFESNEAVVRLLLENGADSTHKDLYGKTAFMYGVLRGYGGVVRALLKYGANTEHIGSDGRTAVRTNHGGKGPTIILPGGEPLDGESSGGVLTTALVYGVIGGDEAVVRALLEHGANIEYMDPDRKTPLMYGVFRGYEAVVRVLLEYGANIEHIDFDGKTALTYGVFGGDEAVIQILLEHGANSGHRDLQGRTALTHAVLQSKEAVIKVLFGYGAGNKTTNKLNTAAPGYIGGLGNQAFAQTLGPQAIPKQPEEITSLGKATGLGTKELEEQNEAKEGQRGLNGTGTAGTRRYLQGFADLYGKLRHGKRADSSEGLRSK